MKKTSIIKWFSFIFGIIALAGCKNQSSEESVNPKLISSAEKLFDLNMTASERDSMITSLESQLSDYKIIHSQAIDNSIPPAVWFNPVPAGVVYNEIQKPVNWNLPTHVQMPADKNELAWYSVADLSVLIKTRKISSVDLTRFFLE